MIYTKPSDTVIVMSLSLSFLKTDIQPTVYRGLAMKFNSIHPLFILGTRNYCALVSSCAAGRVILKQIPE